MVVFATLLPFIPSLYLFLSVVAASSIVAVLLRAMSDERKQTTQGVLWCVFVIANFNYSYQIDSGRSIATFLGFASFILFAFVTVTSPKQSKRHASVFWAIIIIVGLTISFAAPYILQGSGAQTLYYVSFVISMLALLLTRINASRFLLGILICLNVWLPYIIFYDVLHPEYGLNNAGLLISSDQSEYSIATSVFGLHYRLGASVLGPESLAVIILVWMVLWRVYTRKDWQFVIPATFAGLAIIATADRFGMAAYVICIVLFAIDRRRHTLHTVFRTIMAATLLLVIFYLLIPNQPGVSLSSQQLTLSGRVPLWQWAVGQFSDLQWIIGKGVWDPSRPEYIGIPFRASHLHNAYLGPLWAMGFAGVISVVCVYVCLWRARNDILGIYRSSFLALWAVLFIFAWSGPVFTMNCPHGFWVLIGAILVMPSSESENSLLARVLAQPTEHTRAIS